MPRKSTLKLSRRVVEALAVERGDRVFYDRDLTGFGVRVHASGRKVYVVHARVPGGALKRVAIGRKVDITFEDARRVAAEVIDRLKKGEEAFPEPPAPEPTVADLAARYVEAHLEVNRRVSAGRSALRSGQGEGGTLEAACARLGLDRHAGQNRQRHPGRRERVADALFKADVPAIEGRLQSRGGAQIGARGHDAEHA